MRFTMYEIDGPTGPLRRLGVASGGTSIIDVNIAYRRLLEEVDGCRTAGAVADRVVPPELLTLLQTGDFARRELARALAHVDSLPPDDAGPRWRFSREETRPLAPLQPRSLREFGEFEQHISRGGLDSIVDAWYEYPIYWKGSLSVIGPGAVIPWPSYSSRLDFELEIAAVIGKPGRDIDVADALDHVAGFTIFNDVSARDRQAIEMTRGVGPSKSKDFANVLGPDLVTVDELGDLVFDVEVLVNGESWLRTSTAAMKRSWAELIAYASQDEWLEPGDVLVSGTVDGCCALEHLGWPSSGPLLAEGDIVELSVDGLGILRNTYGTRAGVR